VLLSLYLSTYLKAKIDFPLSAVSIDERICELIGFYIWYCKKMVLTNVEKSDTRQVGCTSNTPQNVGSATLAKGIGGIKSAFNGVYKEISKTSNEIYNDKKQISE
jgi:hypothetical protein